MKSVEFGQRPVDSVASFVEVVYLGAFPEVEAGDVLEASVTLTQSEENPRQYHISIETS